VGKKRIKKQKNMKILVIDNYDSFTYNLVHALKKIEGVTVAVKRNDEVEPGEPDKYDKMVLSPGPGLPDEAADLLDIIKEYAGKKPMLGVCLGHQAIAVNFGATLKNMDQVLHGVATDVLNSNKTYLFNDMPGSFKVGRYHSWIVDNHTLPSCLEITCVDSEGRIMAFQHKEFDLQGVQFHPESVLTPLGEQILENWVKH
jgi:anthranilate synthase component 2